eukprot:TRINITY_DN13436_c0_g1_i1.p2 TRINITY_DN13436_c0_g1~~TRINITY_DN13436_c0_g1_i1.p2  ORF type:complete len:409 (+),score=124.68 TRINITY_DN13436_c0_g1_i1:49-1275(+)
MSRFVARAFLRTSARRLSAEAGLPGPDLLTLSDTEEAIRSLTAQIARDKIKPLVREMDANKKMDKSIFDVLFQQGLMGIEVPEEYGGAGLTFFESVLVIEELAKVDPAVSVMCDVQNTLVVNFFRNFASEELRAKWFPRIASNTVGSFCLSEASSGSDAFALKCRATRDGDGYRLTGSKLWITNAGEAGVYLVLANLDPSKKHRGITCFVVPRDAEGLSLGAAEDKLGIRASSTHEVRLDNVYVPKEDLLGEEGRGYAYAIETLNEGRIGIAAQMLGLAQGAFDSSVEYMQGRKQFGQAISDFQGMQFQIADAAVKIQAARLLTYNAARRKVAGLPFVQDAAMAKLYASQVAGEVSSRAVEWTGGCGFVKDYPFEKFYRDAKIGAIYEGTSNIQMQTIAKYLLKNGAK